MTMALTNFPNDPRFDLSAWVGQRRATFRFALIDGVTGQPLRDLTPLRSRTPSLVHDTGRTIVRTLTVDLGAADTAVIDPINNRILLYMIAGGQQYPLGRYMFIDSARERYSSGSLSTLSLVDEMFIVDQSIESGFSALVTSVKSEADFGDTVTSLESVDQTATRLVAPLPVTMRIEGTPYSSVGSWTVGTSRARILESLSVDGDYLSPWFDNDGVLRLRRTFDASRVVPDFDFDEANKVIAGSISETDTLLQAANRVVVVSNGAVSESSASGPIVGVFNVPNSAPHSLLNRGFVIADVREMQVDSQLQAEVIARNIAIRSTAFEITELATPPDPRHDGYNVIRWDGKLWLEIGWAMELAEGGAMRHTLQRVYT